MLIFYLHLLCYIKTRTNVKFPLYLKKAGLASRNIVHLQKNHPTLCRFLLLFIFLYRRPTSTRPKAATTTACFLKAATFHWDIPVCLQWSSVSRQHCPGREQTIAFSSRNRLCYLFLSVFLYRHQRRTLTSDDCESLRVSSLAIDCITTNTSFVEMRRSRHLYSTTNLQQLMKLGFTHGNYPFFCSFDTCDKIINMALSDSLGQNYSEEVVV